MSRWTVFVRFGEFVAGITAKWRGEVDAPMTRPRLFESKGALVVGLGLALFAIVAPKVPLLENLELLTQDVRFQLRGPRPSSANVVVIGIDNETQAAWQDRPQIFWGDRYAAVIRNARALGVKEIGIDIIPATPGEEYMQLLIGRALGEAQEKVSSGGSLSDATIDAILKRPDQPELRPDSAFKKAVIDAGGHVALAKDLVRKTLLVPELAATGDLPRSPAIGFATLPKLPDDAARLIGLFATDTLSRDPMAVMPSLSALVAARTLDDNAHDDSLCRPDRASDLLRMARGRASLGGNATTQLATFLINPPQRVGTLPPIVSALKLAADPASLAPAERKSLQEKLQGAVAILGFTAAGSGNDVYRAPGGVGDVPGPVFQAWATATLIDGAAIVRLAWWQEGLIAAGIVVFWTAAARAMKLNFVPGLILAFGLAAVWSTLALFVFVRGNLFLPIAVPVLLVVADALLTYGVASVEERVARAEVERIFGKNVSPEIMEYLLKHDVTALEKGSATKATVLFFDVRGSTTFAESRDPEVVIAALNALLAEIVPIVEAQEGIINRFTGDGFIALFGVPKPMTDVQHARAAAQTAIEIASLLKSKAQLASNGGDPNDAQSEREPVLSGGCGVHTGNVVYGYLGAKDRAEFAVIGDTVNLAARLEGLNKKLDALAVISKATYDLLPGELRRQLEGPLDRAISGRSASATVFKIPK